MSDLIDRRTLIQRAGAGVVAGSAGVAQAAPTTGQSAIAADDLIVRKIPKGEDVLPAIGLGTFMTFDLIPGARRENLLEVTRRFWAGVGALEIIVNSALRAQWTLPSLLRPGEGWFHAGIAATRRRD